MSGHEKFYIPHDDLQELNTAMEALETDIETLDVSIQQLITAFMLPSSEMRVTGNAVLDEAFGTENPFSQVLDTDHDRYIVKARMRLLSTPDPFIDYSADVLFTLTVGGNVIMSEFLCEGKYPAIPMEAGPSGWAATRMVTIPHTRVAAGATITGTVANFGVEPDFAVIFDIWHVKGL